MFTTLAKLNKLKTLTNRKKIRLDEILRCFLPELYVLHIKDINEFSIGLISGEKFSINIRLKDNGEFIYHHNNDELEYEYRFISKRKAENIYKKLENHHTILDIQPLLQSYRYDITSVELSGIDLKDMSIACCFKNGDVIYIFNNRVNVGEAIDIYYSDAS